jgi:arylsulfatase A-like enzyme/Flp pilus assembly protein TadD
MARKIQSQSGAARPANASARRRTHWPAAAVSVALLALVAAGGAWWIRHAARPHVRKTAEQNVLLVTIDTLRSDTLALYSGRAASHNLSSLARRGYRFDFAHAHAVVTLPSHASILTGLLPHQHGIRDNSGYRLDATTPTLATRLGAAGFSTGAFVAAFPLDARFGLDRGFDVYDDRFGESRSALEFAFAERPAADVVAAARTWIGKQTGKWFAWVHVFDPHAPYRPPSPFAQQYASAPYEGEVAYVDHAVGPLLDDIAGASARPTLVLVTSDHGEALGEHGEQTHGLFAYEASLKVPLILAQVPQAPSDEQPVSQAPVCHADIVPTVLDALGLDVPGDLPGHSLLDVIHGSEAGEERAVYFEAMSASLNRGWAPLRGVILDRHKFIDLPIPELYDLSTDAGERANLIARDVGRRRALEARLAQFGSTDTTRGIDESPDVVARLRSLGYLTGAVARKARYTEADDPKRLVDLDGEMQRGVTLVAEARLEEAAAVYRGVLLRRPDMALAFRHLAFVLWELGRPADAIATLRHALRGGASTAQVRTQLATYLAEWGSPREALALLGAEAGRSRDVETINALGIAFARSGARADALQAFDEALALDARNAVALQNLGALHLESRDFGAAREAFTRALGVDPRLAAAHTGLGVVEEAAGDLRAAIGHWRIAVELDPSEFNALYNLATSLVRTGAVAEAIPHLERFVSTAPPARYARDIEELRTLRAQIGRGRAGGTS